MNIKNNKQTNDTPLDKITTNKFFKKMKSIPINNKCADCSKQSPIWVTVTYSLFLCSECASLHRKMGVLKSVVKSTLLDKWKTSELKRIFVGGNIYNYKLGDSKDIFVKYKDVEWYKKEIDRRVEENKNIDVIDFEDESSKIKSSEVCITSLPKFLSEGDCDVRECGDVDGDGDSVVDESSRDSKATTTSNSTSTNVKDNTLVIKKKNKPVLSKNKNYFIEDESRLGFMKK